MEKVWIASRWKMNKALLQAQAWRETRAERRVEMSHAAIQPFVIPPFTALLRSATLFSASR